MSSINKNKTLFVVQGFEVKEGSTYVVKDKPDLDGPSGLVALELSKLPSAGVDESFQARYVDVSGTGNGVWDTGFYEYSPCYSGMPEAEVKVIVKNLMTNVAKPYINSIGATTDDLNHRNNAFWDYQNFKLYSKQVFNTDNVVDRFHLYFALLTMELTPVEQIGDARYNRSSYYVIDKTKSLKSKEEKTLNQFAAIGLFQKMAENEFETLKAVLMYSGLTLPVDPTTESLSTLFYEFINSGADKLGTFLSTAKKSTEDKGLEEILIFKAIKSNSLKGKNVTKNSHGQILYRQVEVGPDLKSAAKNILMNPDLSEFKKEILFDED